MFFRKKELKPQTLNLEAYEQRQLIAFKQQLGSAAKDLLNKSFPKVYSEAEQQAIIAEIFNQNIVKLKSIREATPEEQQVWLYKRLFNVLSPKIDAAGELINGSLWNLSREKNCLYKLETTLYALISALKQKEFESKVLRL